MDLSRFPPDLQRDWAMFLRWCQGDEHGAQLLVHLFWVCHLWDDLIDGDPRPPQDINGAFWIALVDIPANPFYLRHQEQLRPLIASAINEWHAANDLEASRDPHDLTISYTLRCSVLTIALHCAYLAGGPAWAQSIGAEVRRYGQRETLETYRSDLLCRTPLPPS